MWGLHTTMAHNSKWHSRVQIISWMNAFFRNHYSDVAMRAQQTYPTTNGGIWRRGKKSSFHWAGMIRASVFPLSFITCRPRQWIEFQKPINKGDVHSAWQLSQASVPLSFARAPSLLLFLSPFLLKCVGKERWKLKSGRERCERRKKKRRWDAFMLWLSFHWTDKGKHQGQEWMCFFLVTEWGFWGW